jgi:hypothetical protein
VSKNISWLLQFEKGAAVIQPVGDRDRDPTVNLGQPPTTGSLLEKLFPNSDQRNTEKWLSNAKRKVFLLQKVQPPSRVRHRTH